MVTLYCQSCGERHIDNLTSAAITYCYKCQGTHFANIQPAALRAEREPATEAVRDQALEEAAQAIEDWHEEPDDAWAERQIADGLAARVRALKGKGASQGAEEDKCSK